MEYKKLISQTIRIENPLYYECEYFKNQLESLDEKKHKDFLSFLFTQRCKNITLARLNKYIRTYKKILINYNLKSINQNTFNIIYLKIQNLENSKRTQADYLVITKQILRFFKLHKKIDFDDYKIKFKQKIITSQDLLTEDEKHIIISQAKNLQKKVFLTLLFDSGARVGEIFNLDFNSFTKNQNNYIFSINFSKTKVRQLITYSHNHLIQTFLKKNFKTWTFNYSSIYKLLKKYSNQFNKNIYPHLARHTKATNFSSILTEQELKNFMGWSPNSKVLNNYIHLNNSNILNKLSNNLN